MIASFIFVAFLKSSAAVSVQSAVMRFALDDDELLFVSGSGGFVDESVRVIDAATPVSGKVAAQGFGFADAGVTVALDVLDQRVDALERLLVFKLPAGIFVSGARRKFDSHLATSYTSSNSCAFASPRSTEAMDSRRMRWFVSEKKGSGASETTSKGSRRRMIDWRRKSRTALDMSRPKLPKRASACLRSPESMRTCNVDVVILKSFVVELACIISFFIEELQSPKFRIF